MEAGWFADPSGAFEVRYHDGHAWTEHVANKGVQARSPVSEGFAGTPPLPVGAQQEPARPQGVFTHGIGGGQLSSSRQQFNVLLLVVVLVVILGSCTVLVSV